MTWFCCLILRTILHPFILSLLQLKNIWNGKEEQKQEIRTYQLIRGCAESPILFIIQVWLITYGLQPWTNTSEIHVKDWEGNVLSLTYLRPVSIAFSFSTILRHSEHISLFLTNTFTILFDWDATHNKDERGLFDFHHLPKEILEKMIYCLKSLIIK